MIFLQQHVSSREEMLFSWATPMDAMSKPASPCTVQRDVHDCSRVVQTRLSDDTTGHLAMHLHHCSRICTHTHMRTKHDRLPFCITDWTVEASV